MTYGKARNPLIRDGVAQQQRQRSALVPDYVRLDEKDLADFLVFAHELSQRVIYYDLENQPDGDWHDFFRNSTPVLLALISKTRFEVVQVDYDKALKTFLAQWAVAPVAIACPATTRLNKLEAVFKVYAELLTTICTWYQRLEDGTAFKSTMQDSVKSNLLAPLLRLYQLEQALDRSHSGEGQQRLKDYRKMLSTLGMAVPSTLPETAARSRSNRDRTLAPEIRSLITNRTQAQTELNGIFRPLFQAYLQIIQQAPAALRQSLEANQTLEPHLALYIAFWEILKPAVADLNRMTQRHLDFFYRQVLRLSELPAHPDTAHVVFKLANFQQNYKLASQTRFTAGPDATGIERFYRLEEDIIINQALVAELKGLWLHSRSLPGAEPDQTRRDLLGLHASPVANSFDGQGGNFPKDQTIQAWLPFGSENRPPAPLGLVIASPVLHLAEGDRTITFTFTLHFPSAPTFEPDSLERKLKEELSIELSGEADWISASISSLSLQPGNDSATEYELTVITRLAAMVEPVLPYNPELSGTRLDTSYPVARLILRHQEKIEDTSLSALTPTSYHWLQNALLKALSLKTDVKGVRNLLFQNDLAPIDATKPFQAFGPLPNVGSSFYIGSQEVFQKPLTALTLSYELEKEPPRDRAGNLDWQQTYAAYNIKTTGENAYDPGKSAILALHNRQWHPQTGMVEGHLFKTVDLSGNLPLYSIELTEQLGSLQLSKADSAITDAEPLAPWSFQSQGGFLRLQLIDDDFRHSEYPIVLARQVLATATQEIIQVTEITKNEKGEETSRQQVATRKAVLDAYYRWPDGTIKRADALTIDGAAVPIMPGEPYTPVIKSLRLDYTAAAKYPVEASQPVQSDCQLFHLHPFDGVAALPKLQTQENDGQTISFLPNYKNEGELLIGLQNLEPATALTLLFQVAPETADTDLEKTVVKWHYLKDNTWQELDDHQVIKDTTNGLIHSGIVKLTIPADISNAATTILNPNLHWVKATVAKDSGAIAHIITIQAQAAAVTFVDSDNDPNHLATPLPAATIANLVQPQPEITQIQQLFPSFGGKVKEQPLHFYTRISEHLRHKGRAITIFDYERLVLERFPEIYKVRCINHGQITQGRSVHQGQMTEAHNLQEIAPGHVTLAVIPTLAHRPSVNDLEPRVNINLLEKIKKYLESISPQWATISVVNPRYELIHVDFRVRFRNPFEADFSFYQRQLEQEIIGFLSPWTVAENAEIHFGGEIYRSSILNFVEERPYVDYLLDFELYQGDSPEKRLKATTSTAQSILVSAPPAGVGKLAHTISQIKDPLAASARLTSKGLGYQPLEQLLRQVP